MRVLVTGAEGFIGSHLVQKLIARGDVVKAFIQYNSFNHWGWLEDLSKEERNSVEIFAGDLRDPFGVEESMRGCQSVLHLGALIAIPYSYHSPMSYTEVNINGTLNVLQAARKMNLERILITSTSEVYGTAQYVPIDEKHPKQGQSPYSATKIGADSLAESFYRSFDLPITIVRPFNTYGPRQSARAFIPTIITQLLSGKPELELGALEPTRDLVYVQDTCEGFMRLLNCDASIGEEVNIATGVEHSIGDVAHELISLIAPGTEITMDENRIRPKKSEVQRLIGDPTKLESLTGWKPIIPLAQGLESTVNWFKEKDRLKSYKTDIYNV